MDFRSLVVGSCALAASVFVTSSQAADDATKIAEIKAIYDPMLEEQITAATPEQGGLLGKLGDLVGIGSNSEIIGAWSASASQCDQDMLIFFEKADAPTVAWWRQPAGMEAGGLIPSIKGDWEVNEDIVVLSIKERTALIDNGISTKPADVALKLQVINVDSESLRLGVPGGRTKTKESVLLDGASEKSFVRCAIAETPS